MSYVDTAKIFTVLFFTFLIISCGGQENDISGEKSADSPINFELPSLKDERQFTFENFRGKPTVINFWASWCVPCREEMPFLQQTWEQKGSVINIVGINVMDSEDEALDVLDEFGITYTNLFDRSGDLSSKLGVLGLPATVFIDESGNVEKKYFGPFLGEKGKRNFNNLLGEIQ